MTVPGRTRAAQILLGLRPPNWFERHSRAVAEVAGWLAVAVERRGGSVDRRLVEAAALLHDVDKALRAADPAKSLPHGAGSAAWLARHGAAELGPVVESHPVTRLAEGRWFDDFMAHGSIEQLIVAYADKRAGQRLISLAQRFADWNRRYPVKRRGAETDAIQARAEALEEAVCRAAGIAPEQVRRLAWTGPALRRARQVRTAA
jgi:hypothetical protein